MINLQISALIIGLCAGHLAYSQSDSLPVQNRIREIKLSRALKVPAMLMGAGLMAKADTEFIGWEDIYEQRSEHFSTFRSHVDDYLQYAPIAGVIALNALGVKGQNKFATQMWLLAKSEFLMTAVVFPLKRITAVPRPDTGIPNSFPSGHSAQAF
ncbi:MAG: hypothetical protein RIA63_09615, partial [Cyclobacteriaceae bacterium]